MALMVKWSCHRLQHHVTYVSVVSSTVTCLSFYIGLICPYRAYGEWNYTSRFSPMIIWPQFNWEFDMQPVYFQTFHHLIWVISPMIGLNSHVNLGGSYSDSKLCSQSALKAQYMSVAVPKAKIGGFV